MLTKKHFKAIAETISKIEDPEEREMETEKWVEQSKKENSLFKEELFREACKPEKEIIKIFIRPDPVMDGYNVISKAGRAPGTEATDDTYGDISTARKVAIQVGEEIQKANPNKKVRLQIY